MINTLITKWKNKFSSAKSVSTIKPKKPYNTDITSMRTEKLKAVLLFLTDHLDIGAPLTDKEWLELIKDFEIRYGNNSNITKKRIEMHYKKHK